MITPEMKRDQFNKIINSVDMVLMNNITEVDPSVWENWQSLAPINATPCDWFLNDGKPDKVWCCATHQYQGEEDMTEDTEPPEQCDWAGEEYADVYQWFAIGDGDADFLKRHNQYVTYSDLLDTFFLAMTHFGTSWDYTSMVDDFDDLYTDEVTQ